MAANATPSSPTDGARAWAWVPSLYFTQGLPYVAVMTLSVVMYKNLGLSNAEIAFYTSWLNLPWVIKPLWSPLVEFFRTKRFWIVTLQLVSGAAFAAVVLCLPAPRFVQLSLAVFWLLAFNSATHDIAADGFYLLGLRTHLQAAFVGVRSTCFRLAMIAGQGGLVAVAGLWQDATGNVVQSWQIVFGLLALLFVGAGLYHALVLPRPASDQAGRRGTPFTRDFLEVFAAFFRRPGIGAMLGFLLLYRFAEAQLLKLVPPFLLDARAAGGLGLTTTQESVVYGTVGLVALLAGGLLGGWMISRHGLKRMLWPMLVAMHAPNIVFLALALAQPASLGLIAGALVVEQFGYGFGFTAYMLYMIHISEGPHKTVHYAICTGFMALGMMVPGLWSGWLQEQLGYVHFFGWVCLATLPSFAAAAFVRIDPAFGRKA